MPYYFNTANFNEGDYVLRRNDATDAVYTVVNPYPQTRDRITVRTPWGETDRVAQGMLRKLSSAELHLIIAYRKLMNDVENGK